MPNKRKKILYILAGLGIYLLATGISYGAFTALARGSIFTSPLPAGQEEGEESADRKALIDITGPKNETCLLNGAKFTKAEKKQRLEKVLSHSAITMKALDKNM